MWAWPICAIGSRPFGRGSIFGGSGSPLRPPAAESVSTSSPTIPARSSCLPSRLDGWLRTGNPILKALEVQMGYYTRGYVSGDDDDFNGQHRYGYVGIGLNMTYLLERLTGHRAWGVFDYYQVPYTYLPAEVGMRVKLSLLTVCGVFLLLYILPLGVRPLVIPDETRYAEIPREMLASGDWIVPRLNGLKVLRETSSGLLAERRVDVAVWRECIRHTLALRDRCRPDGGAVVRVGPQIHGRWRDAVARYDGVPPVL